VICATHDETLIERADDALMLLGSPAELQAANA
jgi:hypothetical protein